MDIRHLTRIAQAKGLSLIYDEVDGVYVLCEHKNIPLMTYAPITLQLITELEWRAELNTLRVQR